MLEEDLLLVALALLVTSTGICLVLMQRESSPGIGTQSITIHDEQDSQATLSESSGVIPVRSWDLIQDEQDDQLSV